MDFFELQDRARRNTTRLVVLFCIAVALTVAALYGAVVAIFSFTGYLPYRTGESLVGWYPGIFAVVAGGTLATVAIGTLGKLWSLRDGGKVVAEALGGTPVRYDTDDSVEQRLINVVEEMAIASGTPVPDVYILEDEPGINAFAAGHTLNDAVVGVTRGCIDRLTREELQGVIAHEFSHIVNGDMRLNIRLISILAGLFVISMAGRTLIRSMFYAGGTRRSRQPGGDGGKALLIAVALGVALSVIGAIGLLFGRLIKSAVSRQREYLADAAAVQFTRNPTGLSGALKKIGGFPAGAEVRNPAAEEASHMFFGAAFSNVLFTGLLSTHPPLKKRIRRLEPSFDRQFSPTVETGADIDRPGARAASLSASSLVPPASAPSDHISLDVAGAISSIGKINPEHLALSHSIIERLPANVRRAAHEPAGAMATALALALDSEGEHRTTQLDFLREKLEAPVYAEVLELLPSIDTIDRRFRMPLAELLIPALRHIPAAQFEELREALSYLVFVDDRLTVFEFALLKVITYQLESNFGRSDRTARIHFKSVEEVREDVAVVMRALSLAGKPDEEVAERAYQAGMSRLPTDAGSPGPTGEPGKIRFPALDAALDRLSLAAPRVKEIVIDACAHCIWSDKVVHIHEAELFRTVALILDCPIPPFVPVARVG